MDKIIPLKFGFSTKPFKHLPAGHPVIALYREDSTFLYQLYLDDEEIEKAKAWVKMMNDGNTD